ncbi:hypothetical protein Fcan01_25179 [Folsomia candida]|uniref:Gustatory receptor n=1 Tax=Folsomia candida TaxID=158441 RepID=A0A226D3C8_FOLCA|nr:hypothetical protein Fcan01_25179 [Folsomia candida]
MWLVTVQMYLWGMGVNLARQAGHLINAEIRLEQYLQGVCKKMNILMAKKPGKKTKMSPRNTLILKVLLFTNFMCPVLGLTRSRRLIANSCNPPFIGLLVGYCSSCGEHIEGWDGPIGKVIKAFAILLEGYYWAVISFRAFFLLFNVTIASIRCMLDYIDLLNRVSDTSAGSIGLSSRISIHRSLQVLEKQINQTLCTRVILATMMGAPINQIFCSYVLIKFWSYLPSAGFLTYPFAIFICVMSVVIFESLAAQMCIKSMDQCMNWLKEKGISYVSRRKIRSLQALRIKVGSNFIDRGTALVTQNFCINQTVSLLLM